MIDIFFKEGSSIKKVNSFDEVTSKILWVDSTDISKDEEVPSKLSKEEEEKLKPVFESVVQKDKFMVQFESMSEDSSPIVITQPEFIRRMMEQQKLGGGGGFYGAGNWSSAPTSSGVYLFKNKADKYRGTI